MLHDLRYAFRFLRNKPVFAMIAAGTLAFGIGGNTAVFTIVDAVALRGLPYPDSGRLVTMGAHREQEFEVAVYSSAPDFFDLRERTRAFSGIAGISPVWNMVRKADTEAEHLECLFVSSNLFEMLGASPVVGRGFLPAEDAGVHGAKVAVLGYSYWQRGFGGRADILGKPVTLDGELYTIAGVLPAGFRYLGEPLASAPTDIAVWLPLAANPLTKAHRGLRFMKILGRLSPGVSIEQARDEIRRTGEALGQQYPQTNRGMAWELQPLRDEAVGRYRSPVFLLLGAVGFVLLLASANVANLLLARAAERRHEISIRIALGASGFRILRQLLTESFVLSVLGGALGTALAHLLLKVLIAIGPESLVRSHEIRLDIRALLFTAGVVLITTLLAGLAPAWRTVSTELGHALRAGGRSLVGRTHRLRACLVVAQVALALVLLIGAGLLIRSYRLLLGVDPGFNPQNLVTISTQVPVTATQPGQRAAVYRAIRDELLAVPGVRQVSAVSRLPMMGSDLTTLLFVEGSTLPGDRGQEVQFRRATPDYFATLGLPLRSGRLFDEHDGEHNRVALVDEVTARIAWPSQDAVGKRVKIGGNPDDPEWTTIIGVVGAVHHFGLDETPRPTIYAPYAESPMFAPILVIRTSGDPSPVVNSLAAAVRSAWKGVPAYNVFLMETLVERSTSQRRFLMLLITSFAVAAMLLAAVGVYGAISYTVSQRTREIGLRMALGASPGAALRLILGHGLRLTAAGLILGFVAAVGMTHLMKGVLFAVQPLDPLVFAAAAAVLGGFAIVACSVPASRATRLDPLVALRDQ